MITVRGVSYTVYTLTLRLHTPTLKGPGIYSCLSLLSCTNFHMHVAYALNFHTMHFVIVMARIKISTMLLTHI